MCHLLLLSHSSCTLPDQLAGSNTNYMERCALGIPHPDSTYFKLITYRPMG